AEELVGEERRRALVHAVVVVDRHPVSERELALARDLDPGGRVDPRAHRGRGRADARTPDPPDGEIGLSTLLPGRAHGEEPALRRRRGVDVILPRRGPRGGAP